MFFTVSTRQSEFFLDQPNLQLYLHMFTEAGVSNDNRAFHGKNLIEFSNKQPRFARGLDASFVIMKASEYIIAYKRFLLFYLFYLGKETRNKHLSMTKKFLF